MQGGKSMGKKLAQPHDKTFPKGGGQRLLKRAKATD